MFSLLPLAYFSSVPLSKKSARWEEIEELATKLEFANLRLKQLDEAKSDFLSIASHQLRTPLTAIKGYASMILEGSYGKISETTKGAVDKNFPIVSKAGFDNRRLPGHLSHRARDDAV